MFFFFLYSSLKLEAASIIPPPFNINAIIETLGYSLYISIKM